MKNLKLKKILSFSLFLAIIFFTSGYKKPDVYKIDAAKNASNHNNVGLKYVQEGWYPAAIQEFKIAISLNPNSQATAVYYTNLGDTFMKMRLYKNAQDCYERAINQYSLNFQYYKNLVKCFKAQGIMDQKIKYYSVQNKNPLNLIFLGLLYIETGDINRGIIKLDEFCMQEPKLLITAAIKEYLKELSEAAS